MNKGELPFVKEMFDNIAPKYDLLNRLLSMRQDVYWRSKMVSEMTIPKDGKILDAACGTGDVIIEITKQKGERASVVGLDFAPSMLAIAGEKTGSFDNLIAGDALDLPFKKGCFDAVTMAFGIRNIMDKPKALNAFHTLLKKGGMILILELTTPEPGTLLSFYLFYFKKLLPLIGRYFSKHSFAYQYLPESVMKFPTPDAFSGLIRSAGFSNVRYKKMTFGIVTLFIAAK